MRSVGPDVVLGHVTGSDSQIQECLQGSCLENDLMVQHQAVGETHEGQEERRVCLQIKRLGNVLTSLGVSSNLPHLRLMFQML